MTEPKDLKPCPEWQAELAEFFRTGEASEAFRRHLNECDACVIACCEELKDGAPPAKQD